MKKFVYKAKKGLEDTVRGVVEADNQAEALNKIASQGLFPISVEEEIVVKSGEAINKSVFKLNFSSGINSSDILAFTQKLSILVRAKVELLQAFKIIYEQTGKRSFQQVVLLIYNFTKEGKPFSASLAEFPKVFKPVYVNIVKAGEVSGRLDVSLEQLKEFLSREEGLKRKIVVALAYPSLLLLVGFSSIFVLLSFVIPRLRPIFMTMPNLPAITKFILNISMLSSRSWWIVLFVFILAVFTAYKLKGEAFFRSIGKKIKRGIPVLKDLDHNQELMRFSKILSLLLKSGVPALKSLEIATLNIEEKRLRESLELACKDIASGRSLAKSMQEHTTLPDFFTKMVAIGEESGRLTDVLEQISISYDEEIDNNIAIITSLIEPVLILVLGLVLGAIVMAVLLPTLQITQMVR